MILSNKVKIMVGWKNKVYDVGGILVKKKMVVEMVLEEEEEEFGIWQREILMGGKCELLDYFGVIYYDCSGYQLKELFLRLLCVSLVLDCLFCLYVGLVLNLMGKEM